MRKYFLIFFIFILLNACSTGSKLVEKNVIKPGMTKLDVNFELSYRSFWDQITVPTAYREYFKDQRKEILAPDKKNKDIYYVFKNVNQPVTCGWILCKEGNGTLEKTFSNYTKAIKFVTGENKEPKKTISIEQNGKVEEIPSGDENKSVVSDLGRLIEDYKSGKISKEQFETKKKQILSE
tara:strand:- start:129 stop:668 length:540 start_codon:yes stop_codon:yes gene_type:complete